MLTLDTVEAERLCRAGRVLDRDLELASPSSAVMLGTAFNGNSEAAGLADRKAFGQDIVCRTSVSRDGSRQAGVAVAGSGTLSPRHARIEAKMAFWSRRR